VAKVRASASSPWSSSTGSGSAREARDGGPARKLAMVADDPLFIALLPPPRPAIATSGRRPLPSMRPSRDVHGSVCPLHVRAGQRIVRVSGPRGRDPVELGVPGGESSSHAWAQRRCCRCHTAPQRECSARPCLNALSGPNLLHQRRWSGRTALAQPTSLVVVRQRPPARRCAECLRYCHNLSRRWRSRPLCRAIP
jgi:hypothetical protein